MNGITAKEYAEKLGYRIALNEMAAMKHMVQVDFYDKQGYGYTLTPVIIEKESDFIDGCSERNGHLYQNGERIDRDGLVDDLYYCTQYTGYCEDDFYGTIYFKTNVPGQFVAVPFAM